MRKVFLLFIFSVTNLFAQGSLDSQSEIYVGNFSGEELFVKFYPIGPIFSNDEVTGSGPKTLYDPVSWRVRHNPLAPRNRRGGGPPLNYVMGLDGYALDNPYNQSNVGSFKIPHGLPNQGWGNWLLLSHDYTSFVQSMNDGFFGWGVYRMEVYRRDPQTDLIDDHLFNILFDYMDFNYPYATGSGGDPDLIIHINSTGDLSLNTFRWGLNDQDSTNNSPLDIKKQTPYVMLNLISIPDLLI
jgi:hypothetical protein